MTTKFYLIQHTIFPLPQLACYDQAKQLVLGTGLMGDNILTHFLSSFIAVSISFYWRLECERNVSLTKVFVCRGAAPPSCVNLWMF